MRQTPKLLRGMLHSMIRKMGKHPEKYVRQPDRDFARPRTLTFDFFEPGCPDFYELSFRIARLQTDRGNTETLITNLDTDHLPRSASRLI